MTNQIYIYESWFEWKIDGNVTKKVIQSILQYNKEEERGFGNLSFDKLALSKNVVQQVKSLVNVWKRDKNIFGVPDIFKA